MFPAESWRNPDELNPLEARYKWFGLMFIMVREGQYVYQVQVVVASAQWLSLEGVLHFLAPNRDQVSISIILRQHI